MALMTLSSLKAILEYVQNHPRDIEFYSNKSPLEGFVKPPSGFTEDQKYHLILAKDLGFVKRLTPEYTGLSLSGQEMLDILNDEVFIDHIKVALKAHGHAEPTDRQILREIRERLGRKHEFIPLEEKQTPKPTLTEFARAFVDAITEAAAKPKLIEKEVIDEPSALTSETPMEQLPAEEK